MRKLTKVGGSSYAVTIPIEMVPFDLTQGKRELGWRERQKLVVSRRGKGLIIEDWKR